MSNEHDDDECGCELHFEQLEAGTLEEVAKVMAGMTGPQVERAMDRFIEHIRGAIPEFAQGIDRDVLLALWCGARLEAMESVIRQQRIHTECARMQTAMCLSAYATAQGLDVEQIKAGMVLREGAMQ